MLVRSAVFALIALPLLFVSTSHAQRTPRSMRSSESRRLTSSHVPNEQVSIELQRQREFLRAVTSRFEAVAVHDVTPLLQYSYVWNALHDNRAQIATIVKYMPPAEARLISLGYDEMEKEAMAKFGDFQLEILSGVLDLDETQVNEVGRAVEDDLIARRLLLITKGVDAGEFANKIRTISVNTEKRILKVLSPEQLRLFDREINFARDRLVG